MRKSVLLAAVTLVLVAGGAGAYALSINDPQDIGVLSEVVRVGDIEQSVKATGEFRPLELVDVGVEVGGQVTSILVSPGEEVKKGQVLGHIDPSNLRNGLLNFRNLLQSQRNGLSGRELAVANALRELARQRSLRDQGFGTAVAYEAAEARLANAEVMLAQGEGDIRLAELNLERLEANLNQTVIRAPISGVIAKVLVPQGAVVNAFQNTPVIFQITKLDSMTVTAPVPESNVINVKPGQKVYFTTLGDDRRHYSNVSAVEVVPTTGGIEPSGLAATRPAVHYKAVFDVPNLDGQFLMTMTADVRIVVGEAKQVLVVPAVAIGPRRPDGRYTVQVVDGDGRVGDKVVSIGLTDGVSTEIKSGLRAGERIVTGRAVGLSG